jgi:hypothetical protein
MFRGLFRSVFRVRGVRHESVAICLCHDRFAEFLHEDVTVSCSSAKCRRPVTSLLEESKCLLKRYVIQ